VQLQLAISSGLSAYGAGPDDLRLRSAGWSSRHHSLSVFGHRMPGAGVCLGYRREIRAGQECRLPENRESDRPRGPLALSIKGRHIADPARVPADPRVSVSVTVRYLTLAGKAFVHFL
jgi:hypothetical protein